jgi:hypothetical protein
VNAQVVIDFLTPHLGREGSVNVAVRGQMVAGIHTSHEHPLLGVTLRPDGLLHFETKVGQALIDPADVLLVMWSAKEVESAGTYL